MSTSAPVPPPTTPEPAAAPTPPTEHYHSFIAPITGVIVRFEHTKTGEQVFRFVRLLVVGVATAYLTHSAVDAAGVVAIAETAFRQVWPSSH